MSALLKSALMVTLDIVGLFNQVSIVVFDLEISPNAISASLKSSHPIALIFRRLQWCINFHFCSLHKDLLLAECGSHGDLEEVDHVDDPRPRPGKAA